MEAAFSLNDLLDDYDLSTFPTLIVDNARSPSCPVSVPRCKHRKNSKRKSSGCATRTRWESIGNKNAKENNNKIIQQQQPMVAIPQQPRRQASMDLNLSLIKSVFSSEGSFASFGSDCTFYIDGDGGSDLSFRHMTTGTTVVDDSVLASRMNARVNRTGIRTSSFDDSCIRPERPLRQPCRKQSIDFNAPGSAPLVITVPSDLASCLKLMPPRQAVARMDSSANSSKDSAESSEESMFDVFRNPGRQQRQQPQAFTSLASLADHSLKKPTRNMSFDFSAQAYKLDDAFTGSEQEVASSNQVLKKPSRKVSLESATDDFLFNVFQESQPQQQGPADLHDNDSGSSSSLSTAADIPKKPCRQQSWDKSSAARTTFVSETAAVGNNKSMETNKDVSLASLWNHTQQRRSDFTLCSSSANDSSSTGQILDELVLAVRSSFALEDNAEDVCCVSY
jgi:hypothetical protein